MRVPAALGEFFYDLSCESIEESISSTWSFRLLLYPS